MGVLYIIIKGDTRSLDYSSHMPVSHELGVSLWGWFGVVG